MNDDVDTETIPNIGVDDFELLPVLSHYPPTKGGELSIYVYIPTIADLGILGLENLVIETSTWSRLSFDVCQHFGMSPDLVCPPLPPFT